MTIELKGNWKRGFAFDVHTLSSVYLGVEALGHKKWESTRSEMGELVYRLKYRGDKTLVVKIVDLLGKYPGIDTLDAIIPIPPTNRSRTFQPVNEIARELGKRVNVEVLDNILEKQGGGQELKNVEGFDERKSILENNLVLMNNYDLSRKNVLLIDDLYRSGSTLTVATDILYQQAHAATVSVLTMTKTRSKR